MKPQVKVILVVMLLAAAAAGAWLANMTFQPPAPLQFGTRIDPPRALPEFNLASHEGKPLRREDLAGRWSLVFFGFTHCPDVCPTTLSTLADVRRRLEQLQLPEAKQPRIVFVSVDPERDTPQIVADYVHAFDPAMLGVTGDPAAMDAFATAMGIAHRKIRINDDMYMVDHSTVVLLLDAKARQAAVFSPPLNAAEIAADYRRMLGD